MKHQNQIKERAIQVAEVLLNHSGGCLTHQYSCGNEVIGSSWGQIWE